MFTVLKRIVIRTLATYDHAQHKYRNLHLCSSAIPCNIYATHLLNSARESSSLGSHVSTVTRPHTASPANTINSTMLTVLTCQHFQNYNLFHILVCVFTSILHHLLGQNFL